MKVGDKVKIVSPPSHIKKGEEGKIVKVEAKAPSEFDKLVEFKDKKKWFFSDKEMEEVK